MTIINVVNQALNRLLKGGYGENWMYIFFIFKANTFSISCHVIDKNRAILFFKIIEIEITTI